MPLLSRYANAAVWLARYMERAENTARLVDVNETFARDETGDHSWGSILEINMAQERFNAIYPETTAESVLHFSILDVSNPDSVVGSIRLARQNARTLRPLISTELWSQLNVLYGRVTSLGPNDLMINRLNRLCNMIKESCQTHTGIAEGTFYRDEAWYFYQMGKHIERADQTSRLLDIKYHLLNGNEASSSTAVDSRQWNAVLRSAAGYHAFRRVHPKGMRPEDVASFLIFDPDFPRSILLNVSTTAEVLNRVRSRYGIRRGTAAMERLDEIQAALAERSIDHILRDGLHEFLDWLQKHLISLSADLGHAFFGFEPHQEQH